MIVVLGMSGENFKEKFEKFNYVIISEHFNHHTKSVHLFDEKLVAHLKQKFGVKAIRKLVYFSDGSGAQYKNKFNLVNFVNHEENFGN